MKRRLHIGAEMIEKVMRSDWQQILGLMLIEKCTETTKKEISYILIHEDPEHVRVCCKKSLLWFDGSVLFYEYRGVPKQPIENCYFPLSRWARCFRWILWSVNDCARVPCPNLKDPDAHPCWFCPFNNTPSMLQKNWNRSLTNKILHKTVSDERYPTAMRNDTHTNRNKESSAAHYAMEMQNFVQAGIHVTPFIKPESASDHQPTKYTGSTENLRCSHNFQTSLGLEADKSTNHCK